jgi:hypothetical protein
MHRSLSEKLWSIAVWAVVVFFVVNLLAMIGSVVVNSFGTRWFNTWLPAGFTPQWYTMAWDEFHLPDILLVHGRGGGCGGVAVRSDRRADGVCDGAAEFSGQAGGDAAVPAAAAGAADHLRHSGCISPARSGA